VQHLPLHACQMAKAWSGARQNFTAAEVLLLLQFFGCAP
jgi:hypothetical protein